jgi:transcriptional regulator with XRE-family HTH domain
LWTDRKHATKLNDMMSERVSEVLARRIKEVREKRGITAQHLAKKCKDLGMPHLSAATISNIETGRKKDGQRTRNITVDELMTLAVALGVAPVHLLVPPAARATAAYWITPNRREMVMDARDFVRGFSPLYAMDRWGFFGEAPEDFFQFTVMADKQLGRRIEYELLSEEEQDPDRVRRSGYAQPGPYPDWLEEGEDDGPRS